MKWNGACGRLLIGAVGLLLAGASLRPAAAQEQGGAAAQPASAARADSPQINELLGKAKTEAALLQRDAEELVVFQRQNLSWKSHALQLDSMRQHVNEIGQLDRQMREARDSGSAWQQEAVDRVNPLLRELADNLEATITHANENQDQLQHQPFGELVQANASLAEELHAMISASVTYGERKSAFEAAERQFAQH